MTSPSARSVSRGRSFTPVQPPPAAQSKSQSRSRSRDHMSEHSERHARANGRRSRSRSPSRGSLRSRSRSYRTRSYSRARSASRSDAGRNHSRSRSRSRTPSPPRSAKIVIEKLTKNINAAHLQEIFGSYGSIADLEMPMNRQFMTNRGIAYILFSEPKHAESAIAHMHEAQLDGAQISVSIVLPRRRFSRSPPPRRPPPNRFGEPHRALEGYGPGRPPPPDRAYGRGGPSSMVSSGFRGRRGRSPPRFGGGGAGYRNRYDEPRHDYRPRSYSPSRSPPRRRISPRYSRSPPPRGGEGDGHGRRRRSPSYSSYSSRSYSRDRSYGRDRGRGRR